jgi:CRISPR-associated protein Cmr2
MRMTWVLLISLGPVQDFILTARKCQDLWYGSWLLSELSGATAATLRRELGDEALVFPSGAVGGGGGGELPREVANKILATLSGDAARVRSVALVAREAMTTALHARREEVFATVGRGDPARAEHFKLAAARAQVDELIEFYWVAVPVGTDGYAGARDEAERLLAARKNTRAWTQPTAWAGPVPKSSLDGVRESVVDESVYRDVAPSDRLRWYGTDRAERLSGLDLLKRKGFDTLFPPTPEKGRAHRDWSRGRGRWRFASTQHLASLPWMIQVDEAAKGQPGLVSAWGVFCDALDAIAPGLLERYSVAPQTEAGWLFDDVDGTLLQENGLADAVGEFAEGDALSAKVKLAEKARRAFFDAVRGATPRSPPPELQPYYAILLADGDRMGAVIDHATERSTHQAISAALAGFAQRVGAIVRDAHHGSLVYSGGDDVLALLPIHTALACVADLHEAFGAALAGFEDANGNPPTLSAGLVFAHQKTPLFETLATARAAERAAKAVEGKDALAFWVDKRGGERIEVTGRFAEVLDDLREMTTFRRRGEIPGRAAHELDGLTTLRIDPLPSAVEADARVGAAMHGVQLDEILRVLTRRRSEGATGKMPEGARTWLRGRALALQGGNAAQALSLRLRAAEAIARGEDEAGLPLPQRADAEVAR